MNSEEKPPWGNRGTGGIEKVRGCTEKKKLEIPSFSIVFSKRLGVERQTSSLNIASTLSPWSRISTYIFREVLIKCQIPKIKFSDAIQEQIGSGVIQP